MKNSSLIKLLAVLVAVIIVIVVIMNHRKPVAPETPNPEPTSFQAPADSAAPKPVPVPESGGAEQPTPLAGQVEVWLKFHNRDAASLLAAFRATGDTNYLHEAALNYPNDPKVEWTVLAQDAFPAERRKWLELFKQSSPDNAVAFYLSAENYFKNGNPDEAVRELKAASDMNGFDNHENESRQDSEDLYVFLGKSNLEAAEMSLAAISGDLMPTLAAFKQVAQGLAGVQKKTLDSGDLDAVSDLYDMGTTLVDNLQNGDDGDYLVSQLDAIAVQSLLLAQLKPNTKYDFLDDDQTPAQTLQELQDQKNSITQLVKSFNAAYAGLTPDEMLDYSERVKDDGEMDAMEWVVEQHPPVSR